MPDQNITPSGAPELPGTAPLEKEITDEVLTPRGEPAEVPVEVLDRRRLFSDLNRFSDAVRQTQAVSVGASATQVLPLNKRRIFATIVNDSTNVVYLGLGNSAVINAGIRLNASGGSIVLGLATDIPYTGPVFAIASGTSVVTVTEL